jgi:hypothetical protein
MTENVAEKKRFRETQSKPFKTSQNISSKVHFIDFFHPQHHFFLPGGAHNFSLSAPK